MMLSYGPAMAAGGAGCLAIAWALFRRAPASSALLAKPGVEDFDTTGRPTPTREKRPLSGVKQYLMPRSGSPSETHAA